MLACLSGREVKGEGGRTVGFERTGGGGEAGLWLSAKYRVTR